MFGGRWATPIVVFLGFHMTLQKPHRGFGGRLSAARARRGGRSRPAKLLILSQLLFEEQGNFFGPGLRAGRDLAKKGFGAGALAMRLAHISLLMHR